MVDLAPGAYRYRTLEEGVVGWDVFALQTALAGIPGFDKLVADHEYGAKTFEAVEDFQAERGLGVDGRAGPATQRKVSSVLARKFRKGWQLPNGIPFGHIEAESGCLVGNHTAPYGDGSRDCGIVQRNTNYTPMAQGFDSPASLMALCRQIADKWADYVAHLGQNRRALELACGSWNAPAFTDALARGRTYVLLDGGVRVDLSPGAPARERIESYMAKVTKYVDWPN